MTTVQQFIGDLWRSNPTRIVGYIVTVLAAIGVTVTTEDVAAVLTVVLPLIAGTEITRKTVYSPETVHKIDSAGTVTD